MVGAHTGKRMDNNVPRSVEAEESLIGCVLINQEAYHEVKEIVSAADFYIHRNRWIWEAFARMNTIDMLTVADDLERNGKLNDIGGSSYLMKMIAGAVTSLNAKSYAAIIKGHAIRRDLINRAGVIAALGYSGKEVDVMLTEYGTAVSRQLVDGNTRSVDAKTAASRSYDATVAAGGGKVNYVPTGLTDLDKWFRMRDGNLTIIAGRPGQGKTSLLTTIALNNALDKSGRGVEGSVLFLSMEMTIEEVTGRFLSQISKVPAQRILDGSMTEAEWSAYNGAVEVFEKLPIIINDLPAMNLSQIRNEARRYLKPGEENLLIVDYLQLATSGLNKQNRVDEVGAVARGLKVYAGETLTPVIAAAQLSRAIETRANQRPILSDLRESGNLEQDSNNVLFIHRVSDELNQDIRKLIVSKQRNGATSDTRGDIEVKWDAEIMRFSDLHVRIENFRNYPADNDTI